MKTKFKLIEAIKSTATEFGNDKGMKLSASLSYYTIFSLAPFLLIMISLAGIFFEKKSVQEKIYGQIQSLAGSSTAEQVQEIIKNVNTSHHTNAGAIIGAVILIIGATGVFTEIQDSINYIWSVKAKPKKGWLKLIVNRALSFSLVISFGFMLIVSLVVNALMDLLSDVLKRYFADYTIYIFYVVNIFVIMLVISSLFAIIFKVLPDAKIRWKDAFIGASFTAVLFLIGKFLIGLYIGKSNIGLTYGTAASVIVILLWVYYSSVILFFGAEFTKVYALKYGGGITADSTAVFIVKQEVSEWPDPQVHPQEAAQKQSS